MVNVTHLNTLLGIMIMMLLEVIFRVFTDDCLY